MRGFWPQYLQQIDTTDLVCDAFLGNEHCHLWQLIKKMPSLLKMPALQVTPDYIDAFFRANNSFLYQLVFDPIHRKLVPLNPYPDDVDPAELHYAGPYPYRYHSLTQDMFFIHEFICSIAIAHSMGQIIKPVCVCAHSHGRIS